MHEIKYKDTFSIVFSIFSIVSDIPNLNFEHNWNTLALASFWLSLLYLDEHFYCRFLLQLLKQQQCSLKVVKGDVGVCGLVDYISLVL